MINGHYCFVWECIELALSSIIHLIFPFNKYDWLKINLKQQKETYPIKHLSNGLTCAIASPADSGNQVISGVSTKGH